MLKNMLLASASAFIVLGAAASLTNMKAVITSGNQAEATLTRDAFDMTSQLNEVRIEQARQAALLSIQETAMRQLQHDLDRASRAAGSMSFAAARPISASEYDIGLDIPSTVRERQAVDYQVAWLQATTLDAELLLVEARYQELAASASERQAEMEARAAERIAQLEKETRFEITRLEEEIDQRDSSIVGLMHRLVSAQSGSSARQLPAREMRTIPPQAARPEPAGQSAPAGERVSEAKAENVVPVPPKTEMSTPTRVLEKVSAGTVAGGVAAYQSGNYTKAFDIWRPLANAGDARAWFYLGALYYEGRGVERDLTTAHTLLVKAANAGHARAAGLRDRVASELTDAQLAAVGPASSR